jgi:hypothetical protein
VARSVPLLHPETRLHVHNLVTLATPHGGLPFGFDESIRTFYNLLEEKKQEHPLTIVSISGGLRDEMMPPEVCHLENNKSISVSDRVISNLTTGAYSCRCFLQSATFVCCSCLPMISR